VRGPLVVSARLSRVAPNRWDIVAIPLVLGVLTIIAVGAHQMVAPIDTLLLDKTGTITLGNRQATEFKPMRGVTEQELADALLEGLDIIPRRRIGYKGQWLEEMDLDAIIARR
jgi:hypothetical protein